MFLDSVLVECILEYFVILNEFVVELGSPLNLGKVESTWIDGIHNLAIDCSSGALLNLRELKLLYVKIAISYKVVMSYLHPAAH